MNIIEARVILLASIENYIKMRQDVEGWNEWILNVKATIEWFN